MHNLNSVDVIKLDKLIQYLESVPGQQYDYWSTSAQAGESKCILAHAYDAELIEGKQPWCFDGVNITKAASSLGFNNYRHFVCEMKASIRFLPISFICWRGKMGKWAAIVALKRLVKRAKKIPIAPKSSVLNGGVIAGR